MCAARSQLVVICVGGDSISQTGCDVCEKMDPNNNAVKNFTVTIEWPLFEDLCNFLITFLYFSISEYEMAMAYLQ